VGADAVTGGPLFSLSNPAVALKILGPTTEQAGETPPPLLLQLPGVLGGLPGVELADVERGMRAFLDQLDDMGQGLTGHRDRTGLYLWLLAGTASALACEMARRQWKSSAVVPALDANRLTDAGMDPPCAR
jgi:hypothetical protein